MAWHLELETALWGQKITVQFLSAHTDAVAKAGDAAGLSQLAWELIVAGLLMEHALELPTLSKIHLASLRGEF